MSLPLTLFLLLLSVALGSFSGWRGARPPDLGRGPRMIPWRFIMLASAALAFLLLIHLAALAGGAPASRP